MPRGSEAGPLTPEQQQELADAGQRARSLSRAGKIATFNVWSIGGFAAITLLFGMGSLEAMMLGLGMAFVARNEFRGRALLRSFDAAGPRLLAHNQLGFMGLIILYCCWSIYRTLYGPGLDMVGMEELLAGWEDLVATLTLAVYGTVIAATAIFQGLLARYYWGQVRVVEEYVRVTPAWVVELQRTVGRG